MDLLKVVDTSCFLLKMRNAWPLVLVIHSALLIRLLFPCKIIPRSLDVVRSIKNKNKIKNKKRIWENKGLCILQTKVWFPARWWLVRWHIKEKSAEFRRYIVHRKFKIGNCFCNESQKCYCEVNEVIVHGNFKSRPRQNEEGVGAQSFWFNIMLWVVCVGISPLKLCKPLYKKNKIKEVN